MTERASALVTILFTDLVGSTELLSRVGDEGARRIFRAHHSLLAETAAGHGGAEVKWLGDGLMAAFSSAADALRCGIAMQQARADPVAGERLAIRVGLNAGEAFRDEADYFGTPVVVARRLCDRASGGQILCSELVAGLLAGRAGFSFTALGALELKGVSQPVAALEVAYQAEATLGLLTRLPFVGREGELARLIGLLGEAAAGRGGLVFVVGEPGIGKSRLVEEVADAARRDGMEILWGRLPGRRLGATVRALRRGRRGPGRRARARGATHRSGGRGARPGPAGPLPAGAPARSRRAGLRSNPTRNASDSSTPWRTCSRRGPAVSRSFSVLDDLHWADRSTVAMLRHLARSLPGQRLLVVATYRDADLGPAHPLTEALGGLPREVGFEHFNLGASTARR